MTFARFLRTPKGTFLAVLMILLVVSAASERVSSVVGCVGSSVLASAVLDGVVLRVRKGRWVVPDGAILSALLVSMVLSPREPWWVVTITAVVGVASKYVVRSGKANVFNPAALGLVATFYVFHTAQSWWGAMPGLSPWWIALLVAVGVFMVQRVSKMPAMLAFLGSYYTLFALAAFTGEAARVSEVYRTPDVQAALFFAFFMVTDPPTSPPKPRDQVIYGTVSGAMSFAFFEATGAAYYLLAGLLAANVWDGWRRARV